jgi:ubiquinone/menaquinone biosynthesis C-methylase UbiE
MVRAVLGALGPVNPGTYLDVGTGRGLMAIAVAKAQPGARVLGVDIWTQRDLVANSKARAERNARLEGVVSRVRFRQADARSLPFRGNTFDGVASSLTIHNLPAEDRPAAFREIHRVLKPGGRFAYLDLEFDEVQNFLRIKRVLEGMGFEGVTYRTVSNHGSGAALKILSADKGKG